MSGCITTLVSLCVGESHYYQLVVMCSRLDSADAICQGAVDSWFGGGQKSVVVPVSVSVAIPTLKQCHTQCLFENLIMLRAMPVIGVRE